MPAFAEQPTARLTEWLLDVFKTDELRIWLSSWDATAPLLDDVEDTTPRLFAHQVVQLLERHNLLSPELFERLAEARPFRIDTLLPAVVGFAGMQAVEPRLALVRTARRVALRDGAVSTFIDRLKPLKDTMVDLRSDLVLEVVGLEQREIPAAIAVDLECGPHDPSPQDELRTVSPAAYRERIEQAIVMGDLTTARQRLIAYLAEHHGLARERAVRTELSTTSLESLPARILEILEASCLPEPTPAPTSTPLPTPGPVTLVCRDIHKSYHLRGRRSFHLHCQEIELRLGELVGVVGPNAGGKSTLLQILAGRLAPDRAALQRYPHLAPVDRADRIDWERVHRGIHFVSQRPPPWRERMSSELSLHAARCGRPPADNQATVEQVCARLGLTGHLDHRWEQLSGGLQLRFELARALVSTAELLILDEPLAPLDINAQASFLEELGILARDSKHPRSILMSTQHVWEVERFADRMLYVADGEVVPHRPATRRCLELSGRFSGEFLDALRKLGTIHWTSSLRTDFLLETRLTSICLVHAEVAKAAQDDPETRIESVRDVSNSLLRALRQRSAS